MEQNNPQEQVSRLPIYIFDLDGTLALIDHRRHLVEAPVDGKCRGCIDGNTYSDVDPEGATCNECGGKGKFKPDWDEFFKLCIKDSPNWPVIGTMMQLRACGCDVRIWSGRVDKVRAATLEWLHVWTTIQPYELDKMLVMRPGGDYRPDEQLKQKWLNALPPADRARLVAVFDDRNSVVKMWRKNGVACFQVAEGDF
jgi:hypothetical protein